jgi:hypothetical protein
MVALVLVSLAPLGTESDREGRVGIFPGAAIPSMYPADTPFWIGYGFAAEPGSRGVPEDETTRFELEVDGASAAIVADLQRESDLVVRKTHVADFPTGLPAGWHDFTGRWYDGGRLILSSRATIQFVEP